MIKKGLRIYLMCILAAAALGVGAYAVYDRCVHTPEYALREIRAAVSAKDEALFAAYVDVDALLVDMHENTTALLAEHIQELHERHPEDWFFRHDRAFMYDYMQKRRERDVAMAHAMLTYYFDDARVPVTREDGAARWGSDELRVFAAHYTLTVEDVGDRADEMEIACRIRGDESTYGRLMPEGPLLLRFKRWTDGDGRYRLTGARAAHADVRGLFAFVDGAERYWALQGWD